ncbi:hypothetical protein [Crossiella cryophila]|uniref:Uncharacterized protein n=1 Tax=Crossiella cryophila TaxID=43355 RepID=A0A7W7CIH8_9PSEU|nr:hypothetical protein [Crossiella cryophila]MBB4681806.1 hypothetical protein [Crossiella cryophila]
MIEFGGWPTHLSPAVCIEAMVSADAELMGKSEEFLVRQAAMALTTAEARLRELRRAQQSDPAELAEALRTHADLARAHAVAALNFYQRHAELTEHHGTIYEPGPDPSETQTAQDELPCLPDHLAAVGRLSANEANATSDSATGAGGSGLRGAAARDVAEARAVQDALLAQVDPVAAKWAKFVTWWAALDGLFAYQEGHEEVCDNLADAATFLSECLRSLAVSAWHVEDQVRILDERVRRHAHPEAPGLTAPVGGDPELAELLAGVTEAGASVSRYLNARAPGRPRLTAASGVSEAGGAPDGVEEGGPE